MQRSQRDLFVASQNLLEQALRQTEEPAADYIRRVASDSELRTETLRQLQFVPVAQPESVSPASAAGAWIADLERSHPVEVGRYEKRNVVGKGGMGVVWRVYDQRLRRLLAMKEPRVTSGPQSAAERELIARFLEEARVTSQLDHPGIVPVHDVGFDAQQRPCFLMRFVNGPTADEVFAKARQRRDGWTITQAIEVVLKVCDAVAYAHSRGVIHRDLKPANIMVGSFGEVYVMDWGLAKVLDPGLMADSTIATDRPGESHAGLEAGVVSGRGQQIGTPDYMSPEQAAGLTADHRSDVYAIGAIVYELLAGKSPHADSNPSSTREQVPRPVRTEAPRRIEQAAKGTSDRLIAVVERAMARRPEDRYQSVAALAADLRAFLDDRAVAAHRTGPIVELQLWIRRNRPFAAALAVSVLLLSAGVFLGTTYMNEVAAMELRESWSQEQFRIIERERLHRVVYDDLAALERLVQDCEIYPNPQITHLLTAPFIETTSGWPWGLRRRLEAVRQLHALHQQRGAHAWRRVLAELAADPRFHGHEILVDPDLVPLWRDRGSGLQWFWHPPTGDAPEQAPDGRAVFTEATGLVFVLVPPGTYRRGSHLPPDPKLRTPEESASIAESFERYAMEQDSDTRQCDVVVEPFYISVWELSQAQWVRIDGDNPSQHRAGSVYHSTLTQRFDGRHPVENVSAVVAQARLRLFGLDHPSESQWEYAYRAGSTTCWFTGEQPLSLVDLTAVPPRFHANVADKSLFDLTSTLQPRGWFAPYSDGYPYHAPVDALGSNAWGIVGMAGNVWEWCSDVYDKDAHLRTVGDQPSSVGDDPRVASIRGGSWNSPVRDAAAFARWHKFATFIGSDVGLRPIRRARWR